MMKEIERYSTAFASHDERENRPVTKTAAMVLSYTSATFLETPATFRSVEYIDLQENEISSSSVGESDLEDASSCASLASSADLFAQESTSAESSRFPTRNRRKKRPYSPDSTSDFARTSSKKKVALDKQGALPPTPPPPPPPPPPKPFRCENCGKPYVVNPTRSRSSKTYGPRRVFDPVSKKRLTVCNACRLALIRPRKERASTKVLPPSEEEKEEFTRQCEQFAASLVESLQDADAARLYCPSFVLKQCLCLQNYLSASDKEENLKRSRNLLDLLKKAKQLCVRREPPPLPKKGEKTGRLRGELSRRSREFEEFVLETRKYLRVELKLCERAAQRVLMYSNNFLHKQLKSTPDQSARVRHNEEDLIIRKGYTRYNLKPISELPKEMCCKDRCVQMAWTHSRLLEYWRAMAKRGQRDARRAVAEMLTPSGGSKANCYKFIKMVTGCGHNTVSLVNEQMWRTKGDREPPEHGLKKYWRQQAKQGGTVVETEEEGEALPEVELPSPQELEILGPQEAYRRLQEHSQQLALVQRQLKRQQQKLEQMRRQRSRPPLILGCCSGAGEMQPAQTTVPVIMSASAPPTLSSQLLQLANPSVIVSMVDPQASVQPQLQALQPQTAVSVLNTCAEAEPFTSISVVPGQPLGNVFFVPDCEALSMPMQECDSAVFTTVAPEMEPLQVQVNPQPLTQVQLSSVPVQLIDVPVQFAVQPALQTSVQQNIETSVQSAVQLALQVPVQKGVETEVESSQLTQTTDIRPRRLTVETDVQSPQLTIETDIQSPQSTIESEFLTPQSMIDTSVQTSEKNFDQVSEQNISQTSEQNFHQNSLQNCDQSSLQNFDQISEQNFDQLSERNFDQLSEQNFYEVSEVSDRPSGQPSPQEMVHCSVQTSLQGSPAGALLSPHEPVTPQSGEILLLPTQPLAFEMEVQTSPPDTSVPPPHTAAMTASVVNTVDRDSINDGSSVQLPRILYMDSL